MPVRYEMKKKTSYLAALLLLTLTASCSQQANINTSKTPTSNPITNPGTTGTTQAITCPRTTPGTGLSCSGTASDGDGCALPIANYTVNLAGNLAWSPMAYATSDFPNATETQAVFSSDGRLRVRLKLLEQPNPIARDANNNLVGNCLGRVAGPDNTFNPAQNGPHRYEELDFMVKFYYSKYNTALNKWEKDQLFFTKEIKNLQTTSCSGIIDISALQLQGSGTAIVGGVSVAKPILIEISDVRTDMFCKTQAAGDPFCTDRPARAQECYKMVVQVVNDKTDDFK